jgi:hypothetical protein
METDGEGNGGPKHACEACSLRAPRTTAEGGAIGPLAGPAGLRVLCGPSATSTRNRRCGAKYTVDWLAQDLRAACCRRSSAWRRSPGIDAQHHSLQARRRGSSLSLPIYRKLRRHEAASTLDSLSSAALGADLCPRPHTLRPHSPTACTSTPVSSQPSPNTRQTTAHNSTKTTTTTAPLLI